MRYPFLLLSLPFLSVGLAGCPEKDPIDRAMEEMEFEVDTDSIMIGDAEPEPDPKKKNKKKTSSKSGAPAAAAASGPTISETDVVAVVKKKKGQVRSCYEKELKTEPDLLGVVSVAWTVTGAGGVKNVQILVNSTGNRDMEGCIKRTIGSWSFPASHGGEVDIEYPFRFVPGG